MVRGTPLPLLAALLLAPSSAAAPRAGTPNPRAWALERIELDLTVEPGIRQLRVEGRLVLRLDAARSQAAVFRLDGRPDLMECDSLEGGAGRVAWSREGDARIARLALPRPVERGFELTATFHCRSAEASPTSFVAPGAALVGTDHGWFPLPLADTSVAARSGSAVIRFHLPPGWRAVTTGYPVAAVDSPRGVTETWSVGDPERVGFVAGTFPTWNETVGDLAIGLHPASTALEDARDVAGYVAESVAALQDWLGAWPPGRLDLVELPVGTGTAWSGAQLGGALVVRPEVLESALGPDPVGAVALLAHLAAHAWWGDRVRAAPGPDVPEALARYAGRLAVATGAGLPVAEVPPGGPCPRDAAGGDDDLVERLHGLVGDGTFLAVLGQLVEARAGRELSLDDLREAFEAAAPGAGVDPLFDEWADRRAPAHGRASPVLLPAAVALIVVLLLTGLVRRARRTASGG